MPVEREILNMTATIFALFGMSRRGLTNATIDGKSGLNKGR